MSNGNRPEVTERRKAGPEIVDCQAHPEFLERSESCQRALRIVDQYALGHFEDQAFRGRVHGFEGISDIGYEFVRSQLEDADIHGDCEVLLLTVPRTSPARMPGGSQNVRSP